MKSGKNKNKKEDVNIVNNAENADANTMKAPNGEMPASETRSKKARNKSRIPDNAREDNSKGGIDKGSVENSELKTRKEINTMRKGREADKGKG